MKKRSGYSITQFFYLNLQTLIFIRKMKQLKFLMIAVTLLMGISLTSCLNSDSDPYKYGGGMAKVVANYGPVYFVSGDITITPTAASVSSLLTQGIDVSKMSGHVVYISYRWDPAVTVPNEDPKNIKNVDLMTAIDLNNTTEVVNEKGATNDSINNAAIISLGISQNSEVKPSFFDKTTLLLPVNYFMYGKLHYLTLKYYPKEQAEGDKTLKLYLHHNAGKDETTNTTSYNYAEQGYLGFFQKTYNLSNIFRAYRTATHTSEDPTTVEIITKENTYTYKLDDTQTKENKYTVTYKETEK